MNKPENKHFKWISNNALNFLVDHLAAPWASLKTPENPCPKPIQCCLVNYSVLMCVCASKKWGCKCLLNLLGSFF